MNKDMLYNTYMERSKKAQMPLSSSDSEVAEGMFTSWRRPRRPLTGIFVS
jgi:hypothetical protein